MNGWYPFEGQGKQTVTIPLFLHVQINLVFIIFRLILIRIFFYVKLVLIIFYVFCTRLLERKCDHFKFNYGVLNLAQKMDYLPSTLNLSIAASLWSHSQVHLDLGSFKCSPIRSQEMDKICTKWNITLSLEKDQWPEPLQLFIQLWSETSFCTQFLCMQIEPL